MEGLQCKICNNGKLYFNLKNHCYSKEHKENTIKYRVERIKPFYEYRTRTIRKLNKISAEYKNED